MYAHMNDTVAKAKPSEKNNYYNVKPSGFIPYKLSTQKG